jgi:hypothetical protein
MMEWINAAVLIVVIVFALHHKKKIKALEDDVALHKEKLALQANMLALQKDTLASQKDLLTSYKDALDSLKAKLPVGERSQPEVEAKTEEDDIELIQRDDMAEEKARFEKEVQERTKTMEWYEKEFSIGLHAILELFLHVPLRIQKSIIAKMPDSVIKKGFKRLSGRIQ